MNYFILFSILISLENTLIECDSSISQIDTPFNISDDQLNDFKSQLDVLVTQTLNSLKSAHKLDTDQQSNKRQKRDIYTEGSIYETGVHRLKGITPLFSTCQLSLEFQTIEFNGQTYGICVSAKSRSNAAQVTIGAITGANGWQPQFWWPVNEPRMVAAFVDDDKNAKQSNLYVLAADSARSDGTDLIVINKQNILTKEQHTVNSEYPTAIAVWKSRTDNMHHLAIANSRGPHETESFKSNTFTYNWMGTYFDKYSSIETFYVKDICAFNIHSNEFLAIANYITGPNIIQVDSEIFKLDIDRKKWKTFQRIRTFGAVDWEFFALGSNRHEEYFLAVANSFDKSHDRTIYEVNSVIYKFSDDKFVPFQCLPTVGATQIKSYRGKKGEFVIAVSNMFQSVHVYQYNGWHFVRSQVQYTSGGMSAGVVSLHFDYISSLNSGALFVSNPTHPTGFSYKVEFSHENQYGEWYNKSVEWCKDTNNKLASYGTDYLNSMLNNMYYVDQKEPIVIDDDLLLDDVTILDNLTAPKLIEESSGEELSHKIIEDLMRLDQEMDYIDQKIGRIMNLLKDALRTNGEQVVTAPYVFNSVEFDCEPNSECIFRQTNAQSINGFDVHNLISDVLPIKHDININHSLHFEKLRSDNNIILDGTLNGVLTSNIVTLHDDHNIIARKTFLNTVEANEVIVGRFINNKVINPMTVLLTVGDQIINNSITFKGDIIVSNLEVSGLMSGHSIDKFYDEIVTKDGNHIITGEKYFSQMILNELHMRAGATIDGIDIMKLWHNVLWSYSDQEIIAQHNFTNIDISNNLYVDGLINGARIPHDILLVNQNAVIAGHKVFSNLITMDKIEILHSINGIGLLPITNDWSNQLDIMIKSRLQTVVAPKTFNYLHIGGHSIAVGTVDGVKLSEFERNILMRDRTQYLDNWEIDGNVFFNGGLRVNQTISGFNIEDLYHKTLKLTDSVIPEFKMFQLNIADLNALYCNSINGHNIGQHFMTKNTPQIINGRKTFLNSIEMGNDLNAISVNGFDLKFINDTLLYDSNQYVSGEKTFDGDLWINSLITNNLNSINMNDVIHINRDEIILSPKAFKNIRIVGDLNVQRLETPFINGINLNDFYENTLQYDKKQKITGKINFESIVVPKGANFDVHTINGVNLNDVLSDAVLVDIPQTIYGAKTFVSPIIIDNLIFTHSFDNVTNWDINHNWMLQDVKQTVYGNIVFDNQVVVNDNIFIRNSTINNINIVLLNNSAVKIDEPTVIKGNVHFSGIVISNANIYLNGKFQGIDLSEEAITLSGNHRVNGHIVFANGFDVDQHLNVMGTIDNVNVHDLCQFSVRKYGNQFITAPIIVSGNVMFRNSINVGDKVNGINLNQFNQSVVKTDTPITINGRKRFKNLIIDAPVSIKGKLDSVNIDHLFDNYLSLTRDQVIKSKIVFMDNVDIENHLLIRGDFVTPNGIINGINLREFDATVLKNTGNQIITGKITFENDAHFGQQLVLSNNKLNNINILQDLMLKGRDNVITAPKVFAEDVIVENHIDVGKGFTIENIDISEMARNAVMRDTPSIINGNKYFNTLEVDHLRVKLINGIEFSEKNLLLKYGNQQIFGSKKIESHLKINADIKASFINGINITALAQRLVLKGYDNTITAVKSFNSPLSVNQVLAYGKVDGVDVSELSYFVQLPFDILDLRTRVQIQEEIINRLQIIFREQSLHLAYYELVTILECGEALLNHYNTKTKNTHLFFSGKEYNGCQEIEVYQLSGHSPQKQLLPIAKLYTLNANSIVAFSDGNELFLLISNTLKNSMPECVKRNPSSSMSYYGTNGPSILQLFKYNEIRNIYEQIAIIGSEQVSDMKVIRDQTKYPCIALAIPVINGKLGNSKVFCMDDKKRIYHRETLPMNGIDQITIVQSSLYNMTLMASANSWTHTHATSEVFINIWSQQLAHFDQPIKVIPFQSVQTLHLTESIRDTSLFLFVAEKKTYLNHVPMVRIFRCNYRHTVPVVEVQQIKQFQVSTISSTVLDDYQLLVFMMSEFVINVFQLKGVSGFVQIDTISSNNANNFMVFNNYDFNGRIDGHYISLYLNEECNSYASCKHENHILKSIINGKLPENF